MLNSINISLNSIQITPRFWFRRSQNLPVRSGKKTSHDVPVPLGGTERRRRRSERRERLLRMFFRALPNQTLSFSVPPKF